MKTLKICLDPTKEQKEAMDLNIEANRYVYNNFLTACKRKYESTGELPSIFNLNKLGTRFRRNCPFIRKAYSMTLNETSKRAIRACEDTLSIHKKSSGTLFLENWNKIIVAGPHFPRYKKEGQFESYTYPTNRDFSFVIDEDEKTKKKRRKLRLGKVKGLIITYNQSTRIDGDIKTCTICREDMGHYHRYYACITYDDTPIAYPNSKGPIGVDIGISNIAALSDGTIFRNEHDYQRSEKELKRIQRRFSKTQSNTKEWKRLKNRLIHIHDRIKNKRKNTIEQISNHIVKNHDTIVMEDLSVKDLRSISRNRRMTKGYNDASIGYLRKRIFDKAESAGRMIVLVDPRGTSQICSNCKETVKKDLSVRVHICPYCGYIEDRDVNAAKNMLARASLPLQGQRGGPATLPDT